VTTQFEQGHNLYEQVQDRRHHRQFAPRLVKPETRQYNKDDRAANPSGIVPLGLGGPKAKAGADAAPPVSAY
jgi:hypothetical protein